MTLRLIAPILIAAMLLPGCGRPRPAQARPALFLIADADTTIWLFGTMHVLPPDVAWRTPLIEQAMAEADTLVTELPPLDPSRAAATFTRHARGDGLPPLVSRVPPARRAALEQAITASGLSRRTLDGLKSWAAATSIETARAGTLGADVDHGVETVLTRAFSGRARLGLESLDEQLGLLDGLTEADQRALLIRGAVEGPGYRRTLAAWMRGDVATLARIDDRLFDGQPGLEETLLTNRNVRWSRWVAARLRRPGRIFMAVGAGHLAGQDSVPALLRRQGFVVRRVQ